MNKMFSFCTFNAAVIFLSSAFTLPVAADELYKWVDERGRVTYQSSPPPEDAAEIEKSAISTTVSDEAEDPAEEVVVEAVENQAVSITLFTNPECVPCEDFRAFLGENEIAFDEVDISEDTEMAAEMKEKHGHNTVPTIVVGNKSITGSDVNALATLLKNSGFEVQELQAE